MNRVSFIALTASPTDGIVAYGVFDSRSDARLCADWCGVSNPHVSATRPVALFPPDAEPVLTHTTIGGDIFPLPDDILPALEDRPPKTTPQDEHVVALVVAPTAPRVAFAVGPFDGDRADQWLTDTAKPRQGVSTVCCLLPVRASGLAVGPHGIADAEPAPAVVLLDTSHGPVCYGPFDTAMDASLFWHDTTRTFELTNVYGTHICELIPPEPPPAVTGRPIADIPDDGRVRGWVARLAPADGDRDGEPRLVGLFADESNARDWRPASPPDTSPVAAILPVYDP